MKHTPGPWVAKTGGADAIVECPDGRSFMIGDIIYHPENKANARLIAAAPELLWLVREFAGSVFELDDLLDLRDAAVALLERIDGESASNDAHSNEEG